MRTPTFLFLYTLKNHFTGIKTRVNHPAGKCLGGSCLFPSQVSPYENEGDAKSPAGLEDNPLGNNNSQGQLRHNFSHRLLQEQAMQRSSVSLKTIFQGLPSKLLVASLFVGAL